MYLFRKEQLKSKPRDKNRNKNDDDDDKKNQQQRNEYRKKFKHRMKQPVYLFFPLWFAQFVFYFAHAFYETVFVVFELNFFRNEIFRWNLATFENMRTACIYATLLRKQ